MKGTLFFVMSVGLAFGLSSPAAMAGAQGDTNDYFASETTSAGRTAIVEQSQTVTKSGSLMVEKTISSPVMIQGSGTAPVVIEDRIIKQKHFFGIGIWPLFDFEIL